MTREEMIEVLVNRDVQVTGNFVARHPATAAVMLDSLKKGRAFHYSKMTDAELMVLVLEAKDG